MSCPITTVAHVRGDDSELVKRVELAHPPDYETCIRYATQTDAYICKHGQQNSTTVTELFAPSRIYAVHMR